MLAFAAGLGLGPATARAQKFHPGHYTIAMSNAGALTPKSVPENFRGCQCYYKWKDLEPSEGVYDFSKITHDRDVLRSVGKRLFILLQYKAFVRNPSLCPEYLSDTPEHRTFYGGGLYKTASGSFSAVMWNSNVQARYAALIAAVGKAFDQDPDIEGISVPESGCQHPWGWADTAADYVTDFNHALKAHQPEVQLYDAAIFTQNTQKNIIQLAASFPHTAKIPFINGGRLPDLMATAEKYGVGNGGPDIVASFRNYLNRVGAAYSYYPSISTLRPMGTAAQSKTFTEPGNLTQPERAREIFDFGRHNLKLNYIFWDLSVVANRTAILEMMAGPDFPTDEAGGLNSQVPSSFPVHPPILPAPTNLTWSASGNQIHLTWTDNSSTESGFRIERRTDAALATNDGNGCYFAEIGQTAANVSTFTDRAVQPNTTYHYLVRAYQTGATTIYSAYSHVISDPP